jgi:hypothetical protein
MEACPDLAAGRVPVYSQAIVFERSAEEFCSIALPSPSGIESTQKVK